MAKRLDDLRAKRHSILKDLTAELKKGFIEDTFEVLGHKFKMRTLSEEEDGWSDNFITAASSSGMLSSMRVPKLAVAIREIDEVPVDKLFEFPDVDDADEKLRKGMESVKSDPIKLRYWLRDQMLLWLSEESNRPFILKLWEHYLELDKRREEATASIPKT